jgi:hypothetical protein
VVVIDHCQNVEVVVVRTVELTRAVEVFVEVTSIWLLFVIVKVLVVNTVDVPTESDCVVIVDVTNTVLVSTPVVLVFEGPGSRYTANEAVPTMTKTPTRRTLTSADRPFLRRILGDSAIRE